MPPKHGLKLIGLCLMTAFTLTAIAAATAQAEDWLIESGAGVHELVTTNKPFTFTEDKMWTLVASVGGTPARILCNKQSGTGNLETEGKASGKITYSGECKIFLNGVESPVCKPTEPIATNKILYELFEMGGEDYILFSPAEGTTFFTIKYPNEECLLNPEQKISGTGVLKDCEGKGMGFLSKHLLEEASEGLFKEGAHIDAQKFGTNSVRLEGSTFMQLASGQPFKMMLTGAL